MKEARIKISPWIKDTMQSIPLRGAFVFSPLVIIWSYKDVRYLLNTLENFSRRATNRVSKIGTK